MKRVLLTGAAGFIGGHLGNTLIDKGHEVTGLDNYSNASRQPLRFPCVLGDVRTDRQLYPLAKNVDAIVHLAALINVDHSIADPRLFYGVNVYGTMSVLETARRLDKDVVFASTSEIYGSGDGARIDEGHLLNCQSPYAASKVAADRMCEAWKRTYGLRVNIVRTFNIYGTWQSDGGYGGVIAKFTKQALEGKPMTIYGDGLQRRDYMWIGDAVRAYLLALEVRFPSPVNFGTGSSVNILEIAKEIAEYVRPRGLLAHWIFEKARQGEVQDLRCHWDEAYALGWRPTVGFQDGLRRYLDWAISQRERT